MRMLFITFLILSFNLNAKDETPTRDHDGNYNNINNRKEYRYDIYPGLVFWTDFGRPYWRTETRNKTFSNVTYFFNDKYSTTEEVITFTNDQNQLRRDQKHELREIAKRIRADKDYLKKVVIEGYASEPGTEDYNMELSMDRADNVKNYLIQNGVNPRIIRVRSYGEQFNKATNSASRRVEIDVDTNLAY